jgi:hypothetical protein
MVSAGAGVDYRPAFMDHFQSARPDQVLPPSPAARGPAGGYDSGTVAFSSGTVVVDRGAAVSDPMASALAAADAQAVRAAAALVQQRELTWCATWGDRRTTALSGRARCGSSLCACVSVDFFSDGGHRASRTRLLQAP